MSCHNIGRALNAIEEYVIELYESKRISQDVLRELLNGCLDALGYCDGNPNEATKYLDAHYCGKCLMERSEGEPLYTIWNTTLGWRPIRQYCDEQPAAVVGMSMCAECFVEMLSKLELSEQEIEEEKKQARRSENEWYVF